MGIGSRLKKAVRKIIPNEIAEAASVAAPFVAPFNPAVAAAMAGLGSFDQTGRIGSSVKAGLGAYALGQGARYLGGAGFQGNPFAQGGAFRGGMQGFTGGFSSPFGTETGIGSLFKSDPAITQPTGPLATGDAAAAENIYGVSPNLPSNTTLATGDGAAMEAVYGTSPNLGAAQAATDAATQNVVSSAAGVTSQGVTGAGTKFSWGEFMKAPLKDKASMAAKWFGGLDGTTKLALGIGTASAALQYLENKGAEKQRSDFALFRDRPTDFYNLRYKGGQQAKDGGIIGLADGGEPAMEMDYRGGGFIPVGAKERADDVPARLSKNEFVMTADAVRAAGGGSVDLGAQKMYDLMNKLEAQA